MNLKAVVTLPLVFSACFVGGTLFLVHEDKVRSLSPQQFVVALAVWAVSSVLVFMFGIVIFRKKQAAQSQQATAPPSNLATREQRVFVIRLWKGMIALLVLGLVSGLSRARDFPVWATLVGVAMNLLMTVSLIWAVVRLQKSLK